VARKINPNPVKKPARAGRGKAALKPTSKRAPKQGLTPGRAPATAAAGRAPATPVNRPPAAAAKPALRSKPWTAAKIEEAFRRFRKANPVPRGELEHVNPFTLLVAVVLSAQATDAGVNKATRALFAVADTPEKMVALGEDRLRDMIKTIGLYRTKAKNVIALSARLIAEHGGAVPPSRDALEALPGVGRKTANVVLNVAFGAETIAVDTHIFRVANRTGLAPGATPLEVEAKLMARVPPAYRRNAHHWLILHGRYVCKAQRPLCGICLINDLCGWPDKTKFMAAAQA
jgi:endonuclease III